MPSPLQVTSSANIRWIEYDLDRNTNLTGFFVLCGLILVMYTFIFSNYLLVNLGIVMLVTETLIAPGAFWRHN